MIAPAWVPRGPRSWGCRSWISCAPARRQRDGPGGGVAVGVAGVGEHVAERDAGRWHAGQDGDQGADGVEFAGGESHPPGELGDGRACFLAHHGAGRVVVAEEHLAFGAGQVAVAVPPGRLGVGALCGAVPRRAGEALHVGPVDGQRGAGVLVLAGDAGLQQVIADPGEDAGGGALGMLAGQRIRHEVKGALDLPVGELVRAVLPVLGHAEPCLVGLGQRDQRLVHLGEVGGAAVIEDEHHPGQ